MSKAQGNWISQFITPLTYLLGKQNYTFMIWRTHSLQ